MNGDECGSVMNDDDDDFDAFFILAPEGEDGACLRK